MTMQSHLSPVESRHKEASKTFGSRSMQIAWVGKSNQLLSEVKTRAVDDKQSHKLVYTISNFTRITNQILPTEQLESSPDQQLRQYGEAFWCP